MSDNGGRELARRGDGLTRRTLLRGAGAAAWTLPIVTVGMAAPAMAATPEPTPEVGEFCHTCRGAHTSLFSVPLTGLPPLTPVVLNWTVSGSGGGTYNDEGTTDETGSITFQRQYRDTGQPVRCRTVTVTSVQVSPPLGETIPLNETYEGCCPRGGSASCP